MKKTHASLLGIWAVLNLIVGAFYAFPVRGEWGHFHEMNFIWGGINLAMAVFLFWHHHRELEHPMSMLRQMDIQRHAESMLLFNAGLDMAFMAAGVALHQRGQLPGVCCPEVWKGFGSSVLVQSAVLLLQDSLFYGLHVRNRKKVHPHWETCMTTPNSQENVFP